MGNESASEATPRLIPRWWWWRQQALQQEKDDEFAEILRKARASGASSEESQEMHGTVLALNSSGRVLGSGKIVPGDGGRRGHGAGRDTSKIENADDRKPLAKRERDEGAEANVLSDFTCSVRVKRLRKFKEAERVAEMYAHDDFPSQAPSGAAPRAAEINVSGRAGGARSARHNESGLKEDIRDSGSGICGGGSDGDDVSAACSASAMPTSANATADRGLPPSSERSKNVNRKRAGVGKRRKSSTPRVNKGVPKEMWKKVLHRVQCQYFDSDVGQCQRRQPLFGEIREGQAAYCKNHSAMMHTEEDQQHDVKSPRCHFLACQKHPIFGDARLQIAIFCADHRYSHHVDCINRICAHVEGCSRQASFASAGSRTPVFCLAHKESHHVNVRSPRCLYYNESRNERCNKQRSFGIKGGPPVFCRAHSNSSLHINVVSPVCQHVLGCSKIPSFGSVEQGQMLFCSRHRMPHHINLRERNVTADQQRRRQQARTCHHPHCNTRATFGDPKDRADSTRQRAAVACKDHRMAHHVDLVNRMCQELDNGIACARRATHGEPPPDAFGAGQGKGGGGGIGRRGDGGAKRQMSGPLYCRLHRKAGHIDLINKRRCTVSGCLNIASHGSTPDSRPCRCSLHKEDSARSTQRPPSQINLGVQPDSTAREHGSALPGSADALAPTSTQGGASKKNLPRCGPFFKDADRL
jgi:hypothetical protein